MNRTERKMVEILRRGRDHHGYVSVKAEFEAEGTRVDELQRLIEITHRAGLELTLKIGGCESLRDLFEAKLYGASFIVAPMIESCYALEKFVNAKNRAYTEGEKADTVFLFNLETVTAFDQRERLVELAASGDEISGVVFGRVDFCGSQGISTDAINDEGITRQVEEVAELCRTYDRALVVGGGVSRDSISVLRKIRAIRLTRFETRKVVMAGEAIESPAIEEGLLNAVLFELLWLQNKRDYYGLIHEEDARRIEMLESRWHLLAENGNSAGTVASA